jgi:lipid-A-disaccharide synthase
MKAYFVTGEPSGDLLASGLINALRAKTPDVEFYGIGGETMKACGFDSLFDMSELTVMGFFEVLPRLPLILKRIKQTADDIRNVQPDILITVDSWGFVSVLLKRLKKQGVNVPRLHYVAPQVWAWKKGRAKKVAQLVDRLLTLLPYEPQYFEKYGLQCDFVGHPVVENNIEAIALDDFRRKYHIPDDAVIFSILPGSRNSEVKRLFSVFLQAAEMLADKIPTLLILVPTVKTVAGTVSRMLEKTALPFRIVRGRDERYAAFRASTAAIAASGTVSLELALCRTPHLIAYRFSLLTDVLANMLVKVKYANLINTICDREIIPEFTLDKCRAELIAEQALKLTDKTVADKMTDEAYQGLNKLRLPEVTPSERAAEIVRELHELHKLVP